MKIGYARVSKDEQDLQRQITALVAAGCVEDQIVQEHRSGGKARPKLDVLLQSLQPGDVLVVCKLDRFGRSIIDLLNKIQGLIERGIGFVSLGDSFDITTANGRLMLHMLAAFAEYERALIIERVKDGLRQAVLNGKRLGRPKGIVDQGLIDHIKQLIDSGKHRLDIQAELNIKKGKYYRLVNGDAK